MKICYISLFPEVLQSYNSVGMMRKAAEIKAVEFHYVNLRDHGLGPRRQVDDTPYGGGDGMVLKPEPLALAIKKAQKIVGKHATVILPTPRGRIFSQKEAHQLAAATVPNRKLKIRRKKPHLKNIIIICPRYEGYDERITNLVDTQYCLGNYILTGGELPALSISDSVVRLLKGVLGGNESAEKESFEESLTYVEHPHYTRPEIFAEESVPSVLLSGNHAEIEKWRKKNSKTAN